MYRTFVQRRRRDGLRVVAHAAAAAAPAHRLRPPLAVVHGQGRQRRARGVVRRPPVLRRHAVQQGTVIEVVRGEPAGRVRNVRCVRRDGF